MPKIGLKARSTKKTKKAFSSRKQFADWLWLLVVKARAGFTCEISGCDYTQTVLNAHHIAGKSESSLRYSLLNGICISMGIHKFDAHSTEYFRRKAFEDKVRELRGEKIYESLEELAKEDGYPIEKVIEYLLKVAKQYRKEIEQFYLDKYQNNSIEKRRYEYLFKQFEGLK